MKSFDNINIAALEAVSVRKLPDIVENDADGVKNAIYEPVAKMAEQVNAAFGTISNNFVEHETKVNAAQIAVVTAQAAADTAKNAADSKTAIKVAGNLKATVSFSKNIARTATVVVGLASKGYTADEVDVLIPNNATPSSVRMLVIGAMTTASTAGGKVIFLEGDYSFDESFSGVGVRPFIVEGQGRGTQITIKNSMYINCPMTFKDISLNCVGNPGDGSYVVVNNSYCIFDNCYFDVTTSRPSSSHGDIYMSNCIVSKATTIWLAAGYGLYLSNCPKITRAPQ